MINNGGTFLILTTNTACKEVDFRQSDYIDSFFMTFIIVQMAIKQIQKCLEKKNTTLNLLLYYRYVDDIYYFLDYPLKEIVMKYLNTKTQRKKEFLKLYFSMYKCNNEYNYSSNANY